MINLSKNFFWFCTPRGRQGPKQKIRKRPKKLSAAAFKKNVFKNLYCPKGRLQHIKNLAPHFLISESYHENQFLPHSKCKFSCLISSRLKLSIKMGPNVSTKRLCMMSSLQWVILVFTDPKSDHFWQGCRGKPKITTLEGSCITQVLIWISRRSFLIYVVDIL